jgi:mono/diheme cytochrome c family protein
MLGDPEETAQVGQISLHEQIGLTASNVLQGIKTQNLRWHQFPTVKKGYTGLLSLPAAGVLLVACGFSPLSSPTHPLTFGAVSTPTFDADLVEQGRALYTYCTTCHGRTGLGLDEARLVFPETHRKCERCHRPYNSPTSTDPADIFSIGQSTPLRDLATSGHFASPQALYQFIRTTMPRYDPGLLSDEEYWALTAYLWEGLPLKAETPAATVTSTD